MAATFLTYCHRRKKVSLCNNQCLGMIPYQRSRSGGSEGKNMEYGKQAVDPLQPSLPKEMTDRVLLWTVKKKKSTGK